MTDETIANVPILILGNKIDRPEAISEERLREMFGLYGQTTGKVMLFPLPLPPFFFLWFCWFGFFVREFVCLISVCRL